MKIEAFETEYSVEDVVWFMYENKPTRGIVYKVEVRFEEEANLSWTEKCKNIVRKLKSYFDEHSFEKHVSYHVLKINNDDTYYGIGGFSYKTADELFHTKEELLKSL
jgi:hypothetical protein